MTPPPDYLSHGVNRRVMAHVGALSAHSDIASVLTAAVQPLGDVQIDSPDPGQYRYVVVSTKGVIFGVALGMDTVAFRLDDRMKARALATGGVPYPECGPEWVAVVHTQPDSDWPAVDVAFWARKAYVYAREFADR